MIDKRTYRRHPGILRAASAVAIIVDIQERLIPVIQESERVIGQTLGLLNGCSVLKMPVIATEQYPKGLGPLVPEIRERIPSDLIFSKTTFSCCGSAEVMHFLSERACRQVILAGIEAHVCVLQTALDLVGHGYQVHVPFEATSSRCAKCQDIALERMRQAGVTITSVESALLEMLEDAAKPEFKEILKIIK
ncbi:MAG TPA: hydrolase [bacterium]|nr:hydrolase [bacterium]HQL63565.1 hydrolase [bacterium]